MMHINTAVSNGKSPSLFTLLHYLHFKVFFLSFIFKVTLRTEIQNMMYTLTNFTFFTKVTIYITFKETVLETLMAFCQTLM